MKTIPNSPNILYVVSACAGQLLPQQLDLCLHNIIHIIGRVLVPYLLIELFPAENLSGIACKAEQQIKLLAGELEIPPVEQHLPGLWINHKVFTKGQRIADFLLGFEVAIELHKRLCLGKTFLQRIGWPMYAWAPACSTFNRST